MNLMDIVDSIQWHKVLLLAALVAFFAFVYFEGLRPSARRLQRGRDRSARQARLLEVNRPAERLVADLLLAAAGDGPSPEELRSQVAELQAACPLVAGHPAYVAALQSLIRLSTALLGPGWSPSGTSRIAPGFGDLQRCHARLSHEFLMALAAIQADQEG